MLRPGPPKKRKCERSTRGLRMRMIFLSVEISIPCILLAMAVQGGLAIVYSSFRERAQPAGKYHLFSYPGHLLRLRSGELTRSVFICIFKTNAQTREGKCVGQVARPTGPSPRVFPPVCTLVLLTPSLSHMHRIRNFKFQLRRSHRSALRYQ